MRYFSEDNAAARYNAYRPKVHGIVIEWIAASIGEVRFKNAIDIACGTGDSTMPLTEIADSVLGVDASEAMLAHAKQKDLNVRLASYDELKEDSQFDLITTCMAFHWFDPKEAVQLYKKISIPGAIWVIYNFYFAGHETSNAFNRWMMEEYLTTYPAPPRNKMDNVVPKDDLQLEIIREGKGTIPLQLGNRDLVNYLTTQSNIEHAVAEGKSYEEVTRELEREIDLLETNGSYRYNYTYEIMRYHG